MIPIARKTSATPLLGAILMTGVCGSVQGAGFALIEQSASGMGNAYAGAAASAEDASTIFFNPAGLTRLEDRQLVVAGHIVSTSAEFSGTAADARGVAVTGGDGGDAGDAALVPNLYYAMPVREDLVFGLGINAPFGLKTEYDDGWVGRYHAIKSEVITVNINPSLAWQATPRLSLGAGVSAQYIEAELSQAVDQTSACYPQVIAARLALGDSQAQALAAAQGTCDPLPDATAEVKGDDWSFGFNLGLLYEIQPGTRVGLAYRSKVEQDLTGDARFSNAAPLFTSQNVFVPTDVSAGVDLPESVSLSLSHELNDRWTLLADYTWTRWERFDELRIEFDSSQPDSVTPENWSNSNRYSVGVNYRHSRNLTLRAGLAFDEEPIPDAQARTPRIPGNDRRWLALGASYNPTRAMRVDVGYAHLFVKDTDINHTSASAGTITGEYDSSVDILSAQLVWNFQ